MRNKIIDGNRQQSAAFEGNRRQSVEGGRALLIAVATALVAVVGFAGDSAPFLLDTADGARIAAEGEAIPVAYSPRWGNAASCMVTTAGAPSLRTDEGEIIWTPQGIGGHTLTHTAGDLTYTAQFAVLGDDVAVHAGGRLSSSAVWAADKTHLVTAPLIVPSGVSLTIEPGAVVKFMPGASLMVESGGNCTAKGVIFTHVNDDTIGGDTLYDGDSAAPKMGDYMITDNVIDDGATEYRYMYMPPQTLTSSISYNTRLRGYRTYIVSNSVTVASGATLTLQPGTILKFNTGCSLTVNGTLDAQGARVAPIVFTSLKDDAHGGDTNGDGEKTYAQAGDWYQISVPGTANFNYCHVLYNSSTENTGAIDARGGTVNFDNSEIAHTKYECVNAHNSGYFTASNSIFRDSSLGFGYYGSGRVKAYNCVFTDLTAGIRQSGKTLVNCVFYRCLAFTDQSGDGSTFKNCVFYNPSGYGAQSYSKCGANGNIWGDPLFVDPDNGDFRIAANSPCVDAGDGSVAPALDYWGQPRMDVKRVKDTGVPNGDGVCPDIGIYEVPGTANVALPDLAVVGGRVVLNAPGGGGLGTGRPTSVGDTLTITYTVTNRGAAAVSGLVRDLFRFKGADAATAGLTVDAVEIEQAYNVPTGGCVTLTATITVPMLKAGKWKMMVNVGRAPYETMIANNSAEADEVITVTVEPFAVGESKTVEIPAGGVAGAAVAGLPAGGGAIVAALPKGVVFYASAGYVPDEAQHDAEGVLLADGRTALFIPAHEEGETVYVTLVNDSGTAQAVALAALASGDGLKVAKPADVAVTAKGPKVAAKLVLPESVRDGRVYAAWVEYSNSGDEDAELPIFTVSRTGGGATLSATAKGAYSANPLSLVGLAPSAPRGKLKPGEAGRVAFYFMSSGNLSLKLGMVTEKSTSVLNGFAMVAEYRAWMSAAATRLCARGGAEPGFTEVLAQALNEKRGAGGAAVCGTLRHSATKMPMAGYEIALVSTNDLAVVDVVKSDANGAFALAAPGAGPYTVEVRGVQGNETAVYDLSDEDVDAGTISATPYCVVEGVAMIGESAEPVAGAKVVIDDIRTDKFGDCEVETGDDGTFRFASLIDGEYEIFAYPPEGWCMATSGVFTVTNGAAYTCNAVFAERGATVSGRVADAETGSAVTNATVVLTRTDAGETFSARTDSDGRFAFSGIGVGVYAVDVADNDYELQTMATLDVSQAGVALELPLQVRVKPVFTVMNPVGMVSHTAKFSLIADVSAPEWDFDGDGVADSTEAEPTWTYGAVGSYTVALAYTDASGVRRRSVAENAVEVVEAIENKLKAGNVVLTPSCGVTVESVSTNELVLVGAAAAAYAPGTVIGMESGPKGGFIRKVVSLRQDGVNRYVFAVEPGDLDDLYDEYFFTTDFGFSESQVAQMVKSSARRLLAASGAGEEHKIPVYVEVEKFEPWKITVGGASSTVTHYSDPVAGSQTCYKDKKGRKIESYKVKNSYVLKLPVSVAYKYLNASRKLKKGPKFINWNGCAQGPGFWGPWGLYFSIQCDYAIEGNVSGEGSATGEFTLRGTSTVEYRRENGGKEKQKVVERDFSDPGFRLASLSGTIGAELDANVVIGVYCSWFKVAGRVGVGAKVGMTFGIEQELAYEFPDALVKKDGGVKSTFRLTSSLYGAIEVSAKLVNVAKAKKHGAELPWKLTWKGQLELGDMSFKTSGDGLTVNFEGVDPKTEAEGFLLGMFDGIEIPASGHVWSFGDWSFGSGRSTSHTYAEAGQYTVRMAAQCVFPSSFMGLDPFTKMHTAKVSVFDDKPPEPQEPADSGNKTPKQSCDPNEMDGPDGVGEERYVKPGEWMTYTVYFENKSDADVPAQEVRVTNPLPEWLDWSTFEMCEVAFNNQVETGLAGKQNGTITVEQSDTAYRVQATVALDAENGVVDWYLRSVDPARADFNYWPPDGEGLLPPNDETHRGEGHLTYRIKVREDAPANEVITNSATIVFDYNDPIETDPAWWNTVTPVDRFLKAGEYVKMTLAELGYDVPTDGTPYSVVAKGLPAGLKLVSNKAVKDKKGKVVVKAKSEWWIEGVPTAAVDFFTNPPYLVITANGETTTEALPVEVSAQEVVDLGELALGQSINTNGWLAGVGAGWTVSGLPTGLKYATKKVTKKVKSGKKTVVQTVAEAYAVYGKTTKAGLFTITAKKKKGAYYETMKYRVLVRPKAVDVDVFGETLTNITTMAYVPVAWDLTGDDGGRAGRATLPGGEGGGLVETALPVVSNVVKVAGLPSGVTFVAKDTYGYANAKRKTGKYLKQSGQTIVGKPTKPGTYVVTFTKNVKEKVKGKMTTVAKTAQILWTVEPNDAELDLGFNTAGGVVESGVVGLKYDGLMAFTATSNATVTASGLPSGIKLVRLEGGRAGRATLPDTDGRAVSSLAVAWGFEGFTAKAGTYLVTVKATLNGKSVVQRVALVVEALPVWAKGTFNGVVSGEGGSRAVATGNDADATGIPQPKAVREADALAGVRVPPMSGLATITVSAAGKISGKFYEGGTNWIVSAASYTAAEAGTDIPRAKRVQQAAEAGTQDTCPCQTFVCSNVVAKYSYKVKEKGKNGKLKTVTKTLTREFALAVATEVVGGLDGLEDLEHLEDLDVSGGPIRGVVSMVECGGRAGRATVPGGDGGGLVETALPGGEIALPGTVVTAWQNLWGGAYKAVGKKIFTTKSGNKTLAYKTFIIKATSEDGAGTGDGDLGDGRAGRVTLPDGGGGGLIETALPEGTTLTLKVTTAGAVTATLTYDTGKTAIDKKTGKKKKVYYKPTCSTVVIPVSAPDAEEFAGEVPLYFAPSDANNFPGWSGVAPVP